MSSSNKINNPRDATGKVNATEKTDDDIVEIVSTGCTDGRALHTKTALNVMDKEDEKLDKEERAKLSRKTLEAVARFKKNLASPPKSANGFNSKDKPAPSTAASVMSVVMKQKADAMLQKNEIDKKRAEDDIVLKKEEMMLSLEVQKDRNKIDMKCAEDEVLMKKEEMLLNIAKFEHEKNLHLEKLEMRKAKLEVKKAEIASNEKIRILEIEKEERLAMLKLKLEIENPKRT